jgi:hypothetical protein
MKTVREGLGLGGRLSSGWREFLWESVDFEMQLKMLTSSREELELQF